MSNKVNNIYKCELCGNMVEMTHASAGQLVCCGQDMGALKENTTEAAVEKHIPEVTKTEDIVEVTVGSVLHPMEDKHFIEWIELITETEVYRKYLKPGSEPFAVFRTESDKFEVRAYCNLHGLWKANLK